MNDKIHLKDILVVTELKKNLLSVGQFISDTPCTFEFTSFGFLVKDPNHKIIAKGHKQGQLYTLDNDFYQAYNTIRREHATSSVWHQRLGHPNWKLLQTLKNGNKINVTHWTSTLSICVSCQSRKSCKLPFSNSNNINDLPLQKIHCDLWGLAPNVSTQNFRFYVLFTDDFSRFTWLFPLKHKSDFFSCFLKF